MTTETLFGASPTIGSPDNAEDTYSMATRVTFAVAGSILGARIWGATNAIATSPSGAVYTTAGVQEEVKALVGYATAAWNTVMFDDPVEVTDGETRDIVFGPINRYAANTLTLPLTNGNLTGTQGRFIATAALAFPNTVSAGGAGTTWFGIDVLFEAAAGGEVQIAGDRSVTATATGAVNVDRNAAGTRGVTATATGAADLNANILDDLLATAVITGAATVRSGQPVEPVGNSTGWYQLLDIWQEAKQVVMDDAATQPIACPNDGEPLSTGPNGTLFCRFDGWTPE